MERVYDNLVSFLNLDMRPTPQICMNGYDTSILIQKFWGKLKIRIECPTNNKNELEAILARLTGIYRLLYKLQMQGQKIRKGEIERNNTNVFWFQCEIVEE